MLTMDEKKELARETALCTIRAFKAWGRYQYLARIFRKHKPSLYRPLLEHRVGRSSGRYMAKVETLDDLVNALTATKLEDGPLSKLIEIIDKDDEEKAQCLLRQIYVNHYITQLIAFVIKGNDPIETINEIGTEIMKNVAANVQTMGDLDLLDNLVKSVGKELENRNI